MAPMSAPAAKAFSLPVMIMQPMPSSPSNAWSAAPSSDISWSFSALSCLGRFRVMMPTRPSVRTVISSGVAVSLMVFPRVVCDD
ncbi:hypothetical protein Y695_04355 [Hydrogenophaga sp. T4]|nr:hypothetical protein Y695_04355 [Hydrogenophaga sp. T4]